MPQHWGLRLCICSEINCGVTGQRLGLCTGPEEQRHRCQGKEGQVCSWERQIEESEKGPVRTIFRVCRQSWTRTHTHTHRNHRRTGWGKGAEDSRGEHDENSKGIAGFLTECREWAGKLSQQRECTKKRLGMQLRLRTNGEPNSKPKVREEKTKTQRPLTRSQKCFGFISKLGVMSRE